jgi:glycosyltransferase involved in cell wall biosynthesis
MNILFLTNKLPYPPKDGGSIATLNMMTGLKETGHQITCLAINTAKHSYPVNEIPLNLTASIRFLAVEADTSIRPLPLLLNLLFSRQPYIASRFHLGSYARLLDQLLRESPFDLIQMEGPYLGHYIPLIRKQSRARISLRAHNVEHIIWLRKAASEPNLFKRWYLRNMGGRLRHFELNVAGLADTVIPISPVDEDYFREAGIRRPMFTAPAGLSLGNYPASGLPAEPALFFIGALDWLPNQEGLEWFLEKVFPKLLSKVPSLRFHVAGRNAPEPFIRKLEHSRITFHGEVSNASAFMQAYRVMVAPLLTGSGIRIKIIEGMALGRPVVTTPVGMEGIGAEAGRELMVAEDPGLFSDLLIKLLTSEEEAVRLADAGRKFVKENFDTFEISSRLSQFYNSQV